MIDLHSGIFRRISCPIGPMFGCRVPHRVSGRTRLRCGKDALGAASGAPPARDPGAPGGAACRSGNDRRTVAEPGRARSPARVRPAPRRAAIAAAQAPEARRCAARVRAARGLASATELVGDSPGRGLAPRCHRPSVGPLGARVSDPVHRQPEAAQSIDQHDGHRPDHEAAQTERQEPADQALAARSNAGFRVRVTIFTRTSGIGPVPLQGYRSDAADTRGRSSTSRSGRSRSPVSADSHPSRSSILSARCARPTRQCSSTTCC